LYLNPIRRKHGAIMNTEMKRRAFIKTAAVSALATSLTPRSALGNGEPPRVRLGIIGVGSYGTELLQMCLAMPDIDIPALCDIDVEHLARAQRLVEMSGRKKPEGYAKSETDYENMVTRADLDAVIIATPWIWHTPMAVATMRAGKYCAPEVWGAASIDEVWQLVRASEESGMPCMMLENHCYDRDSMAILNMVRQNLFGELVHCQCGYQHDIRNVNFGPDGELTWWGEQALKRNGDLYPTHGIGPIANCLDIDRGNRFVTLTATASKSRGMKEYIRKKFGAGHPNANRDYALGDIVTTVIKCAQGESIVINYDTNSPRPYSNMYRVQGTSGLWMEDNNSIYLEGISPEDTWDSFEPYQVKYEHPLWKKYLQEDPRQERGGAAWLKLRAFLECVRRKIPTPIDVYDTASWIVISPLTEQSIARGGEPVEFPDFTMGRWISRKPLFGLTDAY